MTSMPIGLMLRQAHEMENEMYVAKILLYFGVVMVMLVCPSCANGDYVLKLPNGYLLGRVNADDISIVPPEKHAHNPTNAVQGRAVPSTIEKIDIVRPYVFGYVKYNRQAFISENKFQGYFVLDTVSGNVKLGLSKTEFDAEVHKLTPGGRPIRLRPPSDFR